MIFGHVTVQLVAWAFPLYVAAKLHDLLVASIVFPFALNVTLNVTCAVFVCA